MPTDPGYRKVYTSTAAPKSTGNVNTAANAFESRLARSTAQPDTTDWRAKVLSEMTQPPTTGPMGTMFGDRTGRGGGGGGRGGGGAAGPSPAQVRAAAGEIFNFNAGPYDLMRQNVGNMRTQAQGYNPDFNAYQQQFAQSQQAADAQRA